MAWKPWGTRLGWFALLWFGGVACVGIVALVIRMFLT